MKNKEAVTRIEQAGSPMIDKLFWLAGATENRDLKDLLNEIDGYYLTELFPTIFNAENIDACQCAGTVLEEILDHMNFGFFAEVHYPTCDNFSFKNGKPVAWRVRPGICRLKYLYAESTEGLVHLIEDAGKELFTEFLEIHKNKLKNESV